MSVTNLAFYQFARVEDPDGLVASLTATCETLALFGKIVVAHEGLNGMVAGEGAACDAFMASMHADPRFAKIAFKVSESDEPPFGKLVVRHKPEIVTMREPGVDAVATTAPHLPPQQFRDWLRAGEPMMVVDVRNDYEVAIGTFRGAVNPNTEYFNQFPDWVRARREQLAGEKVVMFCTGGIRCEKATSWMIEELGLDNVYQLEGGVLNYFEQVDDAERDWTGELFVFDERVAVDTRLQETATELCLRCGDPVVGGDDALCECGR